MDSRLDDLIASAAPPVAPRTDALWSDLAALVAASEAAVRPRRRRGRLLGIAGAVAVGLLGAGAAASAAGLVPVPWYDDARAVHAPSGPDAACRWTFAARELEDSAHPVRPAERRASVEAAQDYLAGLGPATPSPGRGESLEAAHIRLSEQLAAVLKAQGLSPHAVSVAAATDCRDAQDDR